MLGAAAPLLPQLSSGLVIAPGQPLRCLLQLFLLKPFFFFFFWKGGGGVL